MKAERGPEYAAAWCITAQCNSTAQHAAAQRSAAWHGSPARRSFWLPGLMQVHSSMFRRGWKSMLDV